MFQKKKLRSIYEGVEAKRCGYESDTTRETAILDGSVCCNREGEKVLTQNVSMYSRIVGNILYS